MNSPNTEMSTGSPVLSTSNQWVDHQHFRIENDARMQLYCPGFQGLCWRLACDWIPVVPPPPKDVVTHYLEVGTLHGANLISVWKEYAYHPESTFTTVDPYCDYSEYNEYQSEQDLNFSTFLSNLNSSGFPQEQLYVYRNFSFHVLSTLPNDFYNLVYIDGNHKPEAVLEDAVMVWRKMRGGGVLIFDDYGWGGDDCTKRGIDAFVSGYKDQIIFQQAYNGQYFVKKIN